MPNSRFGRQPLMDVLAERDIDPHVLATYIDVPRTHVRNAGYGYVTPSGRAREQLARVLDLAPNRLFTEESLAGVPRS